MFKIRRSVFADNLPDSDVTISETCVEDCSETVPGNGSALDVLGSSFADNSLFNLLESNRELGVAHQIPNLNTFFGGSSNPLVLRVECQLGDHTVIIELSSLLSHVGHIPDLDSLASAGSSQVLTIGGNAHTVDVLIMMFE